jgi:hypothetical protein
MSANAVFPTSDSNAREVSCKSLEIPQATQQAKRQNWIYFFDGVPIWRL